MKFRIAKGSILPFLGFFLITIGNGKYVIEHYGYMFEYAGIIALVVKCVLSSKSIKLWFKDGIKILSLCMLLSLGAFVQDASVSGCLSIFATSFILLCFSMISDNVLSSNMRVKEAADSIFCGAFFTALIGLMTGTLGFSVGSDESIIGILFLSGFQVKNYAGGVWFLIFILNYIYSLRGGKQKKAILLISGLFLVLSGSKGACLLCLLFLLIANYKKIVRFRAEHKKLAGIIIGIATFAIGFYVYSNVFSNVETYAYRMRGLKRIIEVVTEDYRRLLFGLADIAYADTGADYTVNMRNYLGWEASTEMSYVNILIKNGLIGYIVYFILFRRFFKRSADCEIRDRNIIRSLMSIMLISGFVETYMVSIHYIVGPVLYILINGLISQNISNKST